ncbi:PKD domain-containing protein [Kitasatospora sp. NPDC049285]|uniref:PKD domain-containing protein n=1 Tax=Kitasatospora sp. NPDC049285 TaxID=3157096 RepID=UPI00342BD1EF
MPVSRRRLVAATAVFAATVALIPSLAHAAGPATGTTRSLPASAMPVAEAGGEGFTTAISPASKSIRVREPSQTTVAASSLTATSGKIIYVATNSRPCTTAAGTGTEADPFCLLQSAVDVAQPGDTVDVVGMIPIAASVTVKTSGISIVGIGNQAWIEGGGPHAALTLDHVSNVTVSNLMITTYGVPAVAVVGSTGVSVDSSYLTMNPNFRGATTLTVDGASSDVTVSRTYIDEGYWSAGARGVTIASGASNVTLASDVMATAGITATGVTGLNITNNTIQRGCDSAIDIDGASSAVAIENNLLEDANPGTDYALGGYQSACTAAGQSWAPDVVVSAASAAGTTADYNDFYIYGSDATPPYSWAETVYPTLTAFRSGTAQGIHDTIDPIPPTDMFFRLNESNNIDAWPHPGSAALNSANPNAPGKLATDFFGHSPYVARGAIEFVNTNPTLAVALAAKNTSVFGFSLTSTIASAVEPLTVSVAWGDGTTTGSSLYGDGTVNSTHSYAKLGTYTITVTVTDNLGIAVSNSVQVSTQGSQYSAYGPRRLLDTRDGTGGPQAQVQPGHSARVKVVGNGGIPSGLTAAVLNVTVTNTASGGFITAYGEGDARPTTSNVNFTNGQTVPNLVIVPVGADGYIDLYNGGWAPVDLIADITGYFTKAAASGYSTIAPARLLDTRDGTGAARSQVAAGSSIPVRIAGNAGGLLPSSGITAVALNVTVTNPRSDGHLTVYPSGQQAPNASNVNYTQGQTIANAVIVPVGADGSIRVLNGGWAQTDVIVDVVGYYSTAAKGAYVPIAPTRFTDTRALPWSPAPVTARINHFLVLGPGMDATAFVLNATVTNTTDAGHLTVSPDPNSLRDEQRFPVTAPNTSTLNWQAGATVPNLVQAAAGHTDGIVDFWNESDGNIDLIVDEFGYYQNS